MKTDICNYSNMDMSKIFIKFSLLDRIKLLFCKGFDIEVHTGKHTVKRAHEEIVF